MVSLFGKLEHFIIIIILWKIKKKSFENFFSPKIHLHPNIKTFNYIEKNCLPKDYGGTCSTINDLHENTVNFLKKMETVFEEEERQRKIVQN